MYMYLPHPSFISSWSMISPSVHEDVESLQSSKATRRVGSELVTSMSPNKFFPLLTLIDPPFSTIMSNDGSENTFKLNVLKSY